MRYKRAMERIYDVFEVRDGRPVWLLTVEGNDDGVKKAVEISETTPNEIRLIHLKSKSTIAVLPKRASAA